MKTIIAERVLHDGADRVALRFPYDPALIPIVKKLPDARWSRSEKYWHFKDSSDVITVLLKVFQGKAYIDYSVLRPKLAERIRMKREEGKAKEKNEFTESGLPELSSQGAKDISSYRRWMERNRYPETTVTTYVSMMVRFLRFVSPKEASECSSEDLIRIVEGYILPRGLSYSFQNQMISSVKKFYSTVYKSVIDPGKLERPRGRHRIPNVLSKEEIRKMLDALTNEKHRVMLSLIYACGLRRSELLNLVPGDIERGRKLVRIRQTKGFRDRVVPISDRTIEIVDSYIRHYKPEFYLFEGQVRGKMYSPTSLEKVLKNACEKAGLSREISLHWLRHSYATHLLESGTDLRYIQELLGHKSSKTTEIYTHVTTKSIQKIRSPFDDL